jgi:hypothetical protein
MTIGINPEIGAWYELLGKGGEFKVVAINDDPPTIEVQYFDGDIEEFTLEEWYDLELTSAVEPEDYAGPYDNVGTEDMGYSETGFEQGHWGSPLDSFQDDF